MRVEGTFSKRMAKIRGNKEMLQLVVEFSRATEEEKKTNFEITLDNDGMLQITKKTNPSKTQQKVSAG